MRWFGNSKARVGNANARQDWACTAETSLASVRGGIAAGLDHDNNIEQVMTLNAQVRQSGKLRKLVVLTLWRAEPGAVTPSWCIFEELPQN